MRYTVNSPFGVVRVVALKGERGAGVDDVRKEVAALKSAIGSPLVATTAAGMTDKAKVYVYTGSESGYTSGHWYYWNGSAWMDGGVYNAAAVNTDATLSVSGMAADAAAVGTKNHAITSSSIEQGGWYNGAKYSVDNRIRVNAKIKVNAGERIVYTNPDLQICVDIYATETSTSYISSSGYLACSSSEASYRVPNNGYAAIFFRKSNNAAVSVSDYTCSLSFAGDLWHDTVCGRWAMNDAAGDLDNLRSSGIYPVNSASVNHWPFGDTGLLIVFENGGKGVQIAVDYTSKMKKRYFSSTFDDWMDEFLINGIIPSSGDADDYTELGVWHLQEFLNGSTQNWPSNMPGTLMVYDTGKAFGIAQFVVDYNGSAFVRYKRAAGFIDWICLQSDYRGDIPSDGDINDYLVGQWSVPTVGSSLQHYPSSLSGRLINFGNHNGTARHVQMVVDYQNNTFVRYKSSQFTDWILLSKGLLNREIRVFANGSGDYATVPEAIKFVMDEYWSTKNKHISYTVRIGAGIFDLTGVVDMISDGDMESTGLFIPPNCAIIGAGKDVTKLTFYYSGEDDDVMSNVSALNMPYESAIKDLTLSVKNIRYCIHSAQPVSSESLSTSNPLIQDVTITHDSVKMEHLGFDDGLSPTYWSPTPYGSGSWSGNTKIYRNCDFVSKEYSGWLNHNRKGLMKGSTFIFDNCTFISHNDALTASASGVNFISWAPTPKNTVFMRNCRMNKMAVLNIRVDQYGTSDGVCAYEFRADNDVIMLEGKNNNSHLLNTWSDGCCETVIADGQITAYTPVSRNSLMTARPYNSADIAHGIALHSAADGEPITAKFSGHVMLYMLTDTSFTVGKKIGWNGSAWVEDNDNPILKVVFAGIAAIV